MALAFQASTSASATASPATTTAFGSTLAAGQLIVVTTGDDSATNNNVSSVTLSDGTALTEISTALLNSSSTRMWWGVIKTGGASLTVSAVWNTGSAARCVVIAQSFNGFTQVPTLDKTAGTTGTSTAANSGATGTTTYANEIVIVGASHASTTSAFSLGTGYTNLKTVNVANAATAQESKVVSSTGAQTGALTIALSRAWGCRVATFSDNTPPTVALNAPADAATGISTTPQVTFTGTDANSDTITYEVEIDTSNAFGAATADSYSETNQNGQVNIGGSGVSGSDSGAQSFTGNGGTLDNVQFDMLKVNSPISNIVAKIFAHSGTFGTSSIPTGAALATSDNVNAATLGTSVGLISFPFSGANRITLTNGTNYCVAVEYTSNDASNLVDYGDDTTSPTHGGNESRRNSSTGVWTATSSGGFDICFYVNTLQEPLINAFSVSGGHDAAQFADITNGAHTDPFVSGEQIGFTIPGGETLTAATTYYWRVRGLDPTGSNTYGAWATTRSFTTTGGTTNPVGKDVMALNNTLGANVSQAVNRAGNY